MKTYYNLKRVEIIMFLGIYIFTNILPMPSVKATDNNIVYPLKQVSKLECRYEDFNNLSSDCKQDLIILNTKDYKKYAVKDG
jgi:hypothetical protein